MPRNRVEVQALSNSPESAPSRGYPRPQLCQSTCRSRPGVPPENLRILAWHGACRCVGMIPVASRGEPRAPRLLDRVREALRIRHYSPKTEEAYCG
jgi:hypothetical protein